MHKLKFRISSALKDIIGKDLITDDYIAVFELVKNSFDAYATRVDIYFENIHLDSAKIVIKDNGKGMNYDDLIEKWLFVAFSAKKEGKEDNNFDYRDKIYSHRTFAGAKGIGRFSCDRLGTMLYLETTKKERNAKTEVLITDWEQFEEDAEKEFVKINVLHESKEKSDYAVKHGTVLEISNLRSKWVREDFLTLKKSLAKLINPSQEIEEFNFKIFIHVEEEKGNDSNSSEYIDTVNGEVQNFIFETLDIRTTKISASISKDGKYISTELIDGGTSIYKIKEENQYGLLSNIDFLIYYMNPSAKNIFTRRMGLASNKFGHIFLYKNRFRVYPYGEPGEDPFKIDIRKAQGTQRYFSNNDILGKIEIYSENNESNDPSRELNETSSRSDGLKKTKAYYQLEECFLEVLRRLEKYVREVLQWGMSIEDESSFGVKTRASNLIAKLTGSKEIIDLEIADNFYDILEASQVNSAEKIIKNINKIALDSGNDKLIEQARIANAKLVEIQKARAEAEAEAEQERKRALEATKELTEQVSQNLFLKSINIADYEEVISLIHHIGIYAGTIDNNLKGIALRIQNNIPLSNEELYDIIKRISFETKKILNVAAFATKANFKLDTEQKEVNIKEYVREYIQNIIPTTTDESLKISVKDFTNKLFVKKLKPIELNIVVDNLISNSKKAGADNLEVQFKENEDGKLEINFIDDGIGIANENLKKIYDLGYTTTDGSGIGLYHVNEIIKTIGGSIKAENNTPKKGVTFTVLFK